MRHVFVWPDQRCVIVDGAKDTEDAVVLLAERMSQIGTSSDDPADYHDDIAEGNIAVYVGEIQPTMDKHAICVLSPDPS